MNNTALLSTGSSSDVQMWLAIAAIIIPSLISLGALIVALWQIKVMRSLAEPAKYQPKYRFKRFIRWAGFWLKQFWGFLIGIVASIFALIGELTSSQALDRFTVFSISLYVGIIVLDVGLIVTFAFLFKTMGLLHDPEREPPQRKEVI